jgi:hypothetical protein
LKFSWAFFVRYQEEENEQNWHPYIRIEMQAFMALDLIVKFLDEQDKQCQAHTPS